MRDTYEFPGGGIVPACRYCGQVAQDDGNIELSSKETRTQKYHI